MRRTSSLLQRLCCKFGMIWPVPRRTTSNGSFVSHIVNERTQGIVKEALKKLGSGEKKLAQVTQDCDKEVSQALSGTPSCKGMYPTLAFHKGTQNKRVTDLYVWAEGGQNYFIAMKIG